MVIEVGTVFRFYFAEAAKTKRSVVVALVGEEKKYATLLLINSELTNFAQKNPNIRAAQLKLTLEGREAYLDHDSFLSCDYIFCRELRELQQAVRNNPGCILGKMSDQDIEKARGLIINGGRFRPIELERFGLLDEENEDED
jgi:hypothetical protein